MVYLLLVFGFDIHKQPEVSIIYLISVLSIVPPKKRPELYNQVLAVSENQIEIFRSGIIDKTRMYEAVRQMGWHVNFIWVK
jgi:hypothetical protein